MSTLNPISSTEFDSAVQKVRFSPSGTYSAVGFTDGNLRVFDLETNVEVHHEPSAGEASVIGIGWLDDTHLLAAYTSGTVRSIDISGTKTSKIRLRTSVFSLGISRKGSKFAVGTENGEIRLFDIGTNREVAALDSASISDSTLSGHKSRVYSTVFISPTVFVSGGWDSQLMMFDLRESKPCVGSYYSPYICGDSIGVGKDEFMLVAGSWRPDNNVEVFDIRNFKKTQDMQCLSEDEPTSIYSLKLSENSKFFMACGSGSNSMSVVSMKNDTVMAKFNDPSPLLDLDFHPKKSAIIVGTAGNRLHYFKI